MLWGFTEGKSPMTRITATAGSVTAHFDIIFAAMIASCAEFCAGARQGRDTEERYQALERRGPISHASARPEPTSRAPH